MDSSQARCDVCAVEPLLWQVAEASQRLVAHAAIYGPDGRDGGTLNLGPLPSQDRVFCTPLDTAFSDLCAAVIRMNARLMAVLEELPVPA